MHKKLTQQKLLASSEYRSTGGLKNYFATTELAATMNA